MPTTTWNQRAKEINSSSKVRSTDLISRLIRVKKKIKDDRISLVSAAMAYYALFSIVPAITSVILIYSWVSEPSEIALQFSQVSKVVPATIQEILKTQLSTLASSAPSSLGIGAIFSFILSLWAASKISTAIIEAMNIIYVRDENRGFFKLHVLAMALIFFGVLVILIALGVIIGVPILINFFKIPALIKSTIVIGSWIVLLGIFSLFLSLTYRYGPNHCQAKWKWINWGAVFAVIMWAATSLLFSWYAKEFGNFNKTYGSLAAIIVLMTWLYLSSFVILLGGEINAELESTPKSIY